MAKALTATAGAGCAQTGMCCHHYIDNTELACVLQCTDPAAAILVEARMMHPEPPAATGLKQRQKSLCQLCTAHGVSLPSNAFASALTASHAL